MFSALIAPLSDHFNSHFTQEVSFSGFLKKELFAWTTFHSVYCGETDEDKLLTQQICESGLFMLDSEQAINMLNPGN